MRSAHVRLPAGPRLHYVEYGDPAGVALVFLHGWPDSWFSFSRVLPLLPDVRAMALDQRGFGDSDRPDDGYSIPELASDVIAFMDALNIERAVLVGHSFGSFVARQTAIAYPSRVDGLVLIGTGFAASNPTTRELQRLLRELPDPIPTEFAREFQASTAYRPLPSEFFERIVVESLKIPPRLWRLAIDRLVEYDDVQQIGVFTAALFVFLLGHESLTLRASAGPRALGRIALRHRLY